ncbi:uncharacterized protein LOC143017759 [Oratosquilla oratoria]|uniref:uncharacterized protein LOC143017759 n=1 Tax=Oratosquilla oratoria TaxID=337810 RepID=UPI003F758EF0
MRDYEGMKKALLLAYGKTLEDARDQYQRAVLQDKETVAQFCARLKSYLDHWMEKDETPQTVEGLRDLMLRTQLERSCPTELVAKFKTQKVKDLQQMTDLADAHFAAYGYHTRKQLHKKLPPTVHSQTPQWSNTQAQHHNKLPQSSPQQSKPQRFTQSFYPQSQPQQVRNQPYSQGGWKGHKEECVTAGSVSTPQHVYLSPVLSSSLRGTGLLVQPGKVNGVTAEVLRDNGSTGCCVQERLVTPNSYTGNYVAMSLINGTRVICPLATVEVVSPFYTGRVIAAVMEEVVADLVNGNIPGAKNFCSHEATTQTCAAVVTREAARATNQVKPLILSSVSDLANSEDVVAEQTTDPTLAMVRKKVLEGHCRTSRGTETRFLKKRGRLYRSTVYPSGDSRLQFVVPEKYRLAVFKLGHHAALGGHMGVQKTQDRIQSQFFWSGIGREIVRMVRSCDVCQKTTDRGRVKPAPLGPLPLISEPFQRVAVDIVGPIIPRAADGAKYILTCVDFATRWPEAVPLRNIETITVAEAMFEIFCHVGIPKQVLSDRGSQFTSVMMEELLRLLAVKGLRTTPYHPMCNGLCERFNGTLKKMLKRMAAEQPKEWPRFIAPLLFAYREVPQASLQFSPFELVYSRSVRGPLQVLRELWDEEEPDPAVKTTYAYVLDLAERLRETCEVAKQELLKAKEVQKAYYDKKTKLRILEEGDQCLFLLPTAHNKLLSQWQGPFEVVKHLSDLNYLVQVGPDQKRFHINMLKKYYTPQVTCLAVGQECLLNRGDRVLSPEQCECLQLVKGQFKQAQMVSAAVVIPKIEELTDCAPLTPEAIQGETVEDVQVPPRLGPEQKRRINSILQRHSAVFSDKPGVAKVDCHEIRLTSSIPVRLKPYPIPIRLVDAVKKEIENMEAAGIIEKSSSPYCSPIVVVRKKDGGVLICGDYRGVNAVTQVDAEPMSNQQEIFAKAANSKIFSKMDLAKGFFQIPLEERSKQVTAVATPNGLYQFKVLPFGLTNSPAVFNRAMRQVLHGIHGVEAFVDDILIHSSTFEEHLEILEKVLMRLSSVNMTVKQSKCELFQQEVQFLRHTLGKGRCGCQDSKIIKIKNASRPTTKKQVRSFLGLVGYYRRFIPNFAVLALPLTELLNKNAPNKLTWRPEQEEVFTMLKNQNGSTITPMLGYHSALKQCQHRIGLATGISTQDAVSTQRTQTILSYVVPDMFSKQFHKVYLLNDLRAEVVAVSSFLSVVGLLQDRTRAVE